MFYALKIAFRYLTANRAQTGLLIAGVAVGVFVFVFMSALIGGLAVLLIDRTVGDIAHISITPKARDPYVLSASAGSLVAVQKSTEQRELLRTAAAFRPLLLADPDVAVVAEEITGNGFMVKGQAIDSVARAGRAAVKARGAKEAVGGEGIG